MNWSAEQQKFWDWITRPQDLSGDSEAIDELFAPHSRLSTAEALAIYNNAYHQRLLQVSSQLYPVLYKTLGEQPYNQLWLAYLAAHPPRPGPMGTLGEHLHGFCQQHSQYGKLPALLDIIRLESLFIALFDRADEPPYTLAQLQQLPQEQWPQMRWQPKQDWALISSRFDLESYWQTLHEYFEDESAEPGSAPFGVPALSEEAAAEATYLIRRARHRMHFQRLQPPMAIFLQAVQDGEDFAAICARLAQHFPQDSVPELSLTLLLKSLEMELLHA